MTCEEGKQESSYVKSGYITMGSEWQGPWRSVVHHVLLGQRHFQMPTVNGVQYKATYL